METTMQPSFLSFRSKLTMIEAIELVILGLMLWFLIGIDLAKESSTNPYNMYITLAVYEGLFLGSWAIYNAYIRIARAIGRRAGTRLWMATVALTGTYTFWSWIILDINRFLMSKLFYRGEAPVEYAVNWKSREKRQAWEEARKAGSI